jgi:hypothetical protein
MQEWVHHVVLEDLAAQFDRSSPCRGNVGEIKSDIVEH